MNLRVYAKTTITQRPVGDFKSRSQVLTWTVCNNFEFESAWKNLTDSGTITLPKSVWINDKNGRRISLASTGINLGGYDGVPLIMRGDTITIDWGYIYYDRLGNELSLTVRVFEGFVSAVTIKKPFVLNIENNMYVLKQTRATGGNNGFFSGKKYAVETMLAEMLSNAGLSFTVNQTTTTSIGDFFVKNETIAEVLERLRKDYHFESYFRGNELRVGSFVYLPSDALTRHVFRFRENIIEAESLEYSRRDDVVLSAVASNCVEIDTGKTTKDGQKKTRRVKLEVLVTLKNGSNTPEVIVGTRQKPIPPNTGGERRTLFFKGATSTEELARLATNELKKYYYTGLKGKFTAFGLPFVQHGHLVDIIDPDLPEKNGRYMVKGVRYSGGIGGLRQEIEIDYLVGRLDADGKFIGRWGEN